MLFTSPYYVQLMDEVNIVELSVGNKRSRRFEAIGNLCRLVVGGRNNHRARDYFFF